MYLLVLILDKSKDFEQIIRKWREIGVTGVTIFDSIGLGRNTLYGREDFPAIASLSKIFDDKSRIYNHTMISIIKTEETLKQAIKATEKICGDFMQPDVGIMFTLKLDRVIGFSSPNGI